MADKWLHDSTRRAKASLIDTTVPNAARVGDYLDGGRNNFEADRRAVRSLVTAAPVVESIAPAARAFDQRVVRFLVSEAGIRQFLDVGTSRLARAGNTHEVAQSLAPECRIVYADNDPMVVSHNRALVTSSAEGAVSSLDADVHEPWALVADAADTLDFRRPVAVLLLATLSFIADIEEAASVVKFLMDAVPSGSHLAVYHQANDLDPAMIAAVRRWNVMSEQPVTLRSREELAGLLDGLRLELVPPGLVPITDWRPDPADPRFDHAVPVYGAVARKPLARLSPSIAPLVRQVRRPLFGTRVEESPKQHGCR